MCATQTYFGIDPRMYLRTRMALEQLGVACSKYLDTLACSKYLDTLACSKYVYTLACSKYVDILACSMWIL